MHQPLFISKKVTLFPYSCRWSQHNILLRLFASILLIFVSCYTEHNRILRLTASQVAECVAKQLFQEPSLSPSSGVVSSLMPGTKMQLLTR